MKGTPIVARSVASHPASPAPILTAVHPEPPVTTLTDPQTNAMRPASTHRACSCAEGDVGQMTSCYRDAPNDLQWWGYSDRARSWRGSRGGGAGAVCLGCPAFPGQRNWCYFMPRAAGSGTRRGPLAESGRRVPNGDESDCTGARCTVQCPPVLSSLSGKQSGGRARLSARH